MIEISNEELEPVLDDIVGFGRNVKDRQDLRSYSEKLSYFCSLFLKQRYGNNYNGLYPFCGLDVLTPFLLGGNWLLFDESWNDYQTEITNYHIPYFGDAINSDRIRIIDQSLDNSKEEVTNFKPEVVLVKYAGVGNYERIFDFLSHDLKRSPLLIISCTTRDLKRYLDSSSTFQLSSHRIGRFEEISLGKQIQPRYQTFFFLDRLKIFEFKKK